MFTLLYENVKYKCKVCIKSHNGKDMEEEEVDVEDDVANLIVIVVVMSKIFKSFLSIGHITRRYHKGPADESQEAKYVPKDPGCHETGFPLKEISTFNSQTA